MGGAGAAAAQGEEAWPAAQVGAAPADRRDPVADPHRCAVAGCARAVRAVGVGVWVIPPLAARWQLGAHPDLAAGAGGCGRADHLGGVGGLHRRPRPPARGRGAKKGPRRPGRPAGWPPGRPTMAWGARGAGCPPRSIWPVSSGRNRCRSLSRRGSAATARSSRPSLTGSGFLALARAGPARARTGCWPTRLTARVPTVPICAGEPSPAPSPRRPTRSATARNSAARGAPARVRPRTL